MAISINWATRVIYIPQDFLTFVSGERYELDVDELRLALKDIEDSEDGAPFPDTHRHNTEVYLAGAIYARTFEIINGYTVEFESKAQHYTVVCTGANHNLADVLVPGSAHLIVNNAAGLIVTAEGGGLTPAQVWGYGTRALTEIGASGIASQASLNTRPTLAEIESSTILAKQVTLQLVHLIVDAIKAKTDSLPADPASQAAIPSAADIWGRVIDSTLSAEQILRIVAAALAGKVSGAAGTSIVFRDLADTKNRIAATVDANGNRTAVTLDAD